MVPDKGGSRTALDVRADGVVSGETPVSFGHAEDLDDVPVGVVVGEEGRVPVLGRTTGLEVAGRGRDGVLWVHDVGDTVAVAVDPGGLPRRGQELHRTHGPGGGGAHVRPVVGLDLPHRREDVPVLPEPVLPGGLPVQLPVSRSGDWLDGAGHYVAARYPELVSALPRSRGRSRLLLEDAGPLGSPELAQLPFGLRLAQAYPRYGLLELLLAAAELGGLSLLHSQGRLVVSLLEIGRA